jgi:PAS domain S-box-containing protein
MPLGYIVWDADFRVLEWNPTAEKIFGWSAAEARGKRVSSLMLPGAGSPPDCMRRALQQGDKTVLTVCAGINKDGKRIACEWHNTPVRDEAGNLRGLISMIHDITGRDQTDRELRESRKFLQTIIETEPECVKLIAADGTLLMMNRAGLDMIQADSLDRVKGRSVCSLVSPENREAFNKLTERVFQGGSGTLAFEMIGIQGRKLWLETHAVPLRNDRNEIIALLGITRDITQRRKTEEALKKERDLISAVLDTVAAMVLVLDKTGKIVRFNRTCEEVSGYTAQEVLGKQVWDFLIPPEQVESVKGVFQNLVAGMFPSKYENYWVAKNGQRRLIALSNTALLSPDGSVEFVIPTGIDITERRRADEALLQEKSFSDAIIDNLPGTFYICEEDGRLIRWNNNEIELTGYSVEELSAMNVFELFREDREIVKQALRDVFTAGKAIFEARLMTKSGVPIPFFQTGFRMTMNGKRYLVGVGIDVSERKRLEDQLRLSQKMESIGTLAGGIAHDFNNILTAIIGYGSLLQMKMEEGDPLRYNVEQILSSANRAALLTQGLLAYSRKQVLNPQPVSVNAILKKVELLLTRLIGEDIELKTMLTDKDVTVLADAGQLEQVLMNLATNARDAMPDGGYLFIETERIDFSGESATAHEFGKPGTYALITVTDSGTGMDEKTRQRIFEPFFTTKEVGKGTGLGLAMAYGIVKQHNGTITVYSEEGRGTTFKIYLPVVQTVAPQEHPLELPPIQGGVETVLVAEDDEIVRTFTRHVLEQFGYTVIEAEDGEDAVNKFMENRDRIKLLLLDVIMPKKNGREVYAKIKIFRPDIKALFLSGYTAEIMHQKGLLEQGVNFIMKPVPVNELLRKLRAILDGT